MCFKKWQHCWSFASCLAILNMDLNLQNQTLLSWPPPARSDLDAELLFHPWGPPAVAIRFLQGENYKLSAGAMVSVVVGWRHAGPALLHHHCAPLPGRIFLKIILNTLCGPGSLVMDKYVLHSIPFYKVSEKANNCEGTHILNAFLRLGLPAIGKLFELF